MNAWFRLATALFVATFAAACGSETTIDITDVPEPDPGPDPLAFVAPVEGDTVFAVDLSGRLVIFGTESGETLSRITALRGLPLFRRIVGIAMRPSDETIYGVGNDSRVYTIDLLRSEATPVSNTPFEPSISAVFDTHFAMAIDPVTDKIRLISTDFGVNWTVDPDDGTATVGEALRYADGDPNEGRRPNVAALAFPPLEPRTT